MTILNNGFNNIRTQTQLDKFHAYLDRFALIDFGYITKHYLKDDLAFINVRSVGTINGAQLMYNHVELLCMGSSRGGFRAPAETGDCVMLFAPRFSFDNVQDKKIGSLSSYSTASMKAIPVTNYAKVDCGVDITRDGKISEWAENFFRAVGADGSVQTRGPNYTENVQSTGATEKNTTGRTSNLGDDGSYTEIYKPGDVSIKSVSETEDSCASSYYDSSYSQTIDKDGTYTEIHNDGNNDTYKKIIKKDGTVTVSNSSTYEETVEKAVTLNYKNDYTTNVSGKQTTTVTGAYKLSAGSMSFDLGTIGTLSIGNAVSSVAAILNNIFSMLVQTGIGLTATGNAAAQGAAITAAVQKAATAAKLLFPDVNVPAS